MSARSVAFLSEKTWLYLQDDKEYGAFSAWLSGVNSASMMRLASCIFFNNSREIFQPLLYLPRNPLLVLIWGTALCWVFAALVKRPADKLLVVKNTLLFEKTREPGGNR